MADAEEPHGGEAPPPPPEAPPEEDDMHMSVDASELDDTRREMGIEAEDEGPYRERVNLKQPKAQRQRAMRKEFARPNAARGHAHHVDGQRTQNINLVRVVKFDDVHFSGDYATAENFIEYWEKRARDQDYDDVDLIGYIESNLEGDPLDWLKTSLKFDLGMSEATGDNPMRYNYGVFKLRFLDMYGATKDPSKGDWTRIFQQRRDQPMEKYLVQARIAIHSYFEKYGKAIREDATPETQTIDPKLIPRHREVYANFNPEQRRTLIREMALVRADGMREYGYHICVIFMRMMLREVGLAGLARKETFERACKLKDEGKDLSEITKDIQAFDRRISNNYSRAPGQKLRPIAVGAVDGDSVEPWDSDEDIAVVCGVTADQIKAAREAAAAASSKKKNQGKPNGNTNATGDQKKKCRFCGIKGHLIKDCRKKKAADRAKAAAVDAEEENPAPAEGVSAAVAGNALRW